MEVIKVDGHNIEQLLKAEKTIQPKLVLANTIKGKGFSFSEDNNDYHKIMSKKQYDLALKELDNGIELINEKNFKLWPRLGTVQLLV